MGVKKVFDKSYNILEYEVDPAWKRGLSEAYKIYRRRWERASKGFLFEFPLCVEIESSYYCNLKCPTCARQVLGTFGDKGFMKRNIYSKILEEAKQYKMPAIMLDHETEPLTNPDMADMAKEARESGLIDIWMHTNANLLTEDISEKLIRNGLTKINFSIDAVNEETYNKVRAGGNYKKVIKNILAFLKLKKKLNKRNIRTRVSFVMQEANKDEKSDFFEFWKDKVNLISFQNLIDFARFSNKKSRSFLKYSNNFVCYKVWQLLIVRYNGDVVPCGMPLRHYNPKDYLLGNLNVDTIKECWNSPKLNRIRHLQKKREFGKISFCRNCISAYNTGAK